MVRTAKEWAEIVAKIAEADPDQKIWIYCYTKEEIEIYNSPEPNGTLPNAEWERVIERFERYADNDALENIWSAFSDATSEELVNLRCDECYDYDYECITSESNETLCANCGEEKDLLE